MSTKSKGTRVFIIVMVAAFLFSSFAFSGLVIWELSKGSDQNNSAESTENIQAQLQEQLDQQNKEQAVKKEPLEGYKAEPFDKASVTGLEVEEIKTGNGKEASASSTVKANYFGWTSDGTIFDSSQKDGTAEPVEFPLNRVIKGWTEGLSGVKAGSVVKLIIPADKAYGESGNPPTIGPNEPLTFIVQLIEVK